MSIKTEIVGLVTLFVLSGGASWFGLKTTYDRVNTPEVVAQKKINDAIREDICERMKSDLGKFKENPTTFRRVGLKILEGESRHSLRYLLAADGVPKDFPIEYRAEESRFAKCKGAMERWLALPSSSQESVADEFLAAGFTATADSSEQQSKGAGSAVAMSRGSRVALVVGNGKYQNRPLRNPENDADDVASALEDLGFKVINVRNAGSPELKAAIDQYLKMLRSSDVGLVYFSGHGVEYAGRNYLLPVDFQANEEDEIPRQSIDLTVLVDKVTKAQGKLNIVIVDACRSSFLSSTNRSVAQGLAKMSPVEGTILAFSTAPGQIANDGAGRNSPYTDSLIRTLKKPGLKVEDIFKETAKLVEIQTAGRQHPWYTSNLTSDYALR